MVEQSVQDKVTTEADLTDTKKDETHLMTSSSARSAQNNIMLTMPTLGEDENEPATPELGGI